MSFEEFLCSCCAAAPVFLECLGCAVGTTVLPKSLGRKRMSLVFGSLVCRDAATKNPTTCLMVPKSDL